VRAGSNSSLSLVILVRKPPNSHISPGCYTPLWLCALAGVYLRGGAPAILTILLIYIHLSTKICNWRWILHLCSCQEFISKRLSECYTDLGLENLYIKSRCDFKFSTSWFLFEFLLIPEGVLGGVYKRKSQK